MSSQLVIVGYHRSGTSALSQNCQAAGLFLGTDLLGAKPSNPFGHFEDRDFFQINEALLKSNLARWDLVHDFAPVIRPEIRRAASDLVARRDAQHELWGFKDPRTCLLLDFWDSILNNPKYLICLRHYSACIDSIMRRHVLDFYSIRHLSQIRNISHALLDDNAACANWCVYMTAVLQFLECRDASSVVLRIDTLSHEASVATMLNERWGLELEPISISETFKPGLFQSGEISDLQLTPELKETADMLWDRLCEHVALQ